VEILVLSPYPPHPQAFGAATRVHHLVRSLAREHRVTVLCFEGPAAGDLGVDVHLVAPPAAARRRRLHQLRALVGGPYSGRTHYSPAMARALARLLAKRRFDLIQVEGGDMAPYYRLPSTTLRVVDEHNVEYQLLEQTGRQAPSLFRRVFNRVEARKLRPLEVAACCSADVVLTTSEIDRTTLAAAAPGTPIHVIPNGVDTRFFAPDGEPDDPASVVFTGAMDYYPNGDGVRLFATEIWPQVRRQVPRSVFSVVGKNPPTAVRALAGDGIVVTGTVLDVRPWMRRAAVFVVPLRIGSGTRLKILEAFATGRAVVSTSIGCAGLDVTPGEELLVADTPQTFADAVVRCLRDPALRARLAARARALVERRYRWDAIGDNLNDLYRDLARRSGRAGEPARVPHLA
jgi:sugar transferase (PEP-CTERM/EpsH1 system associated)